MSFNDTISKLKEMRLHGVIKALEDQRINSLYADMAFDERFALLVEQEYLHRENKRLSKNLSSANLQQNACIEDVDFAVARGIDKSTLAQLATCSYISTKQNIAIYGSTGIGKTYLSCALANKACKHGYTALYKKTSKLLTELKIAFADGSLSKLHRSLCKINLLVLDEWLRDTLSPEDARLLLDVLDDRYQNSSTIFVSQIPITDWHPLINDSTMADAILDRVAHNSVRIALKGESMRKVLRKV